MSGRGCGSQAGESIHKAVKTVGFFLPSSLLVLNDEVLSLLCLLYLTSRCQFLVRKYLSA